MVTIVKEKLSKKKVDLDRLVESMLAASESSTIRHIIRTSSSDNKPKLIQNLTLSPNPNVVQSAIEAGLLVGVNMGGTKFKKGKKRLNDKLTNRQE